MVLRALDITSPSWYRLRFPATLTIGTTFAIRLKQKEDILHLSDKGQHWRQGRCLLLQTRHSTLTEDGLGILGVHVANSAPGLRGVFEDLVNNVKALGQPMQQSPNEVNNNHHLTNCMATCHSLRLIDGELLGDPLDARCLSSRVGL